jgi:hypothetical protein
VTLIILKWKRGWSLAIFLQYVNVTVGVDTYNNAIVLDMLEAMQVLEDEPKNGKGFA